MVQCGDPKSEYRQASWKGVPFLVRTDTTTVGRRGDLYEFPNGEQTGWRDLGIKAAEFSVEGYLIGADHHRQAAAMKAAAESPGPGVLVHPIYGETLVACRSLTITHEIEDARRITSLTFDFVSVGSDAFPGLSSALPLFIDGLNAFIDVVRGNFLTTWAIDDLPLYQVQDSRSAFVRIADSLYRELYAYGHADKDTQDAFTLLRVARLGYGSLDGDNVLLTVHRGIEALYESASAADAIDAMRAIHGRLQEPMPVTDASTRNIQAIRSLTARLLAAYSALATTDLVSPSIDDVHGSISFVQGVMDSEELQASKACDHDVVTAIKSIRPRIQERLLQLIYDAGGNVRYAYPVEIPGGMPSLVLAHYVYGDARRAPEIEASNGAPLAMSSPRMVRLFTEST